MYLTEALKFPGKVLRKVWQKVRKHLLLKILGFWHRRESQYVHTGQVALCCIAKMENAYIRFFVEYYARLGFDKIFVYDNNDENGESFHEVIGDYISSHFVEVIDFRGRKVCQLAAYQDCYDKYSREYDWIAFFDCDEFLTFANGIDDIHEFLGQKKFFPFQLMHVNWKVYGDNEMLDNDGRDVVERFPIPIPDSTKGAYGTHLENEHVKSMVRGGLSEILWKDDPHTPRSSYYQCCNAEADAVNCNSPFQSISYETLFLRHYSTKTIGEWVKNKMLRGFPDVSEEMWKECLTIKAFFRYNKETDEKISYAKRIVDELNNKKGGEI